MALDIYNRYGPRANPADANYPYGSIKNESIPTANDGTPLEKDWGNDLAGFQQRLLVEGGVSPSGNSDTILNSDYYDALKNVLKRNGGKPFATVADLKADTTVKIGDFVSIESYTATNNSGVMFGKIVSAATGVDDGGSFIDLIGSGLQFQQFLPGSVSVKLFGAEGDDVTDDHASMQSAINFSVQNGSSVLIPAGRYLTTASLIVDLSLVTTDSSHRPDIVGAGAGASTIHHSSGGVGLAVFGGVSGTAGVHSYMSVRGLRLEGESFPVAGSKGLQIDNMAYAHFSDIAITGFAKGIQGTDILSSEFETVTCLFCDEGMSFVHTDASRPNAISLIDCTIGNCAINGINVVEPGVFSMRGGSVEGCGVDANGYGIKITDGGTESALGANLDGVYFENNKGKADVWVVQTAREAITTIKACSFARISNTNFTESNIRFEPSNKSSISLFGNGFAELGTYVVDPSRPYVDTSGASGSWSISDFGNRYKDQNSRPNDQSLACDDGVAQVRCRFAGVDGSIANSKNVASVVRNSIGDYTITYATPMRLLSNQVMVTTADGGVAPFTVGHEVSQTANSCRIQTRVSNTGALDDPNAINLTVFGDMTQGW